MSIEQLNAYNRYRTDPWAFLSECVWTKNQVNTAEPVQQFPSQWEYLRLYCMIWQKYRKLAVPKSRRMTMSWTNIALYLHECIFNPGQDFAFISKKEDDSAELVRRAEFIFDHIPEDKIPRSLLPKKDTRNKPPQLSFPEIDSKIQGFPMGADQLRQFTFSGMLADECAFWEDAQKFWAGASPTVEGGGRITLISSRSPGFFQRLVYDQFDNDNAIDEEQYPAERQYPFGDDSVWFWQNPKNKFAIFDIHYTANPNKKDPAFRDAVRSSMPIKDYMVEYERNWEAFDGKAVFEDYSRARHESRARQEPHLGLPLLCGWDFGLCYDDKTEVLTANGWKLFKDVGEQEAVATLNPETKQLEYDIPKLKVAMPFKGELINWSSQNLQATVTPEHIVPHWTDAGYFKRSYAKDLHDSPGHRKIRLTAKWDAEDCPVPLNMTSTLFASFMGLYLSEGALDGNRVCIYQTKEKQWVRDILSATPYKWTEDTEVFRTTDAHLAAYLRQFGSAKDKFIPREIHRSSAGTIREFIRTYTLGDGHIRVRDNGAEEHTIFTSSARMSDELSELALKAGWYSSIRKVKPQTSFYTAESRWITNTGGYNVTFKKSNDYAELRSAKQTKVPYNGTVYCLSVKHSTLYVRKNGRPHWNGNTPACVVAQLQGTRLIILREYVSENQGIKQFCPTVVSDLRQHYPQWSDQKRDFIHYIDPAGLQRGQVDSEKTCASEMMSQGLKNIFPGPIDWESRRKAVEHFLITSCKEGANLQLFPQDAPTLAKGFSGGYQYPEKYLQVEPTRPAPIKNRYSHPHDALQYLCGGAYALRTKKPLREIPTPQYSFTQTQTQTQQTKQRDEGEAPGGQYG